MSWYRKYRPGTFADLVGQDYIRKILLSSLLNGAPSHAYLFSGSRGTGKTSTARILAKALNCLQPTSEGEPCNECANCREIDEQRFVDIIEIDAASNTGVDHIRDLREKIGFAPTSGKAKVYIIDEVHMLSSGAFNALLKTLEEPPSFVYFILATTEIHKVPETIQSRCQRFSFRQITPEDIVQRLLLIADREKIKAEKEALEIIASQAAGGLRDAISLFEQYASGGELIAEDLRAQMGLVPHTLVVRFFETLEAGQIRESLEVIDDLVREGFALTEFARTFLLFLREKLLENARSGNTSEDIVRIVEIFEDAQRKMKFAIIPQLPLEMAIIKASENFPQFRKNEPRKILGIFGIGGEKDTGGQQNTPPESEKAADSPIAKKEEPKSAEFLAPDFTLEKIREAWPQILENIGNSGFRMALRNAEIVSAENEELRLQFSALTWKEQAEKKENIKNLLDVLEKMFSRKIQVMHTVKGIQLEPTIAQETEQKEEGTEGWNPVEALQEIMGAPIQKKDQ